jgi:hypothetical protein
MFFACLPTHSCCVNSVARSAEQTLALLNADVLREYPSPVRPLPSHSCPMFSSCVKLAVVATALRVNAQ